MIKYEQISYTIEENDFLYFEKNGVICQLRVDAEHLNEGKLLMNRFVVGSRQKVLQSEEGKNKTYRLEDLSKKGN